MAEENKLSAAQAMRLGILVEKERNMQAAFGEQVASFHREIEESLGLEAGAIGTTHSLDAESLSVVKKKDEA